MKKWIYLGMLFSAIIMVGSCDYDDSNDIDIIMPNDTTQTGITIDNS